jgi:hypothetical protein
MRISEVISQLKAFMEEHGDIPVTTWPYDGQMNSHAVNELYISNAKATGWNSEKQQWNYEDTGPEVVIDA